jgi:hypothetical protein
LLMIEKIQKNWLYRSIVVQSYVIIIPRPPRIPTVNPKVIPTQFPVLGAIVCPALREVAAAAEVALPNAIYQ